MEWPSVLAVNWNKTVEQQNRIKVIIMIVTIVMLIPGVGVGVSTMSWDLQL